MMELALSWISAKRKSNLRVQNEHFIIKVIAFLKIALELPYFTRNDCEVSVSLKVYKYVQYADIIEN